MFEAHIRDAGAILHVFKGKITDMCVGEATQAVRLVVGSARGMNQYNGGVIQALVLERGKIKLVPGSMTKVIREKPDD